jgi:hypothetical protein
MLEQVRLSGTLVLIVADICRNATHNSFVLRVFCRSRVILINSWGCRACMVGQARLLLAGEVMMERVLKVTPPPHFPVHVEALQSTGHAKRLQSMEALRVGQVRPPCLTS